MESIWNDYIDSEKFPFFNKFLALYLEKEFFFQKKTIEIVQNETEIANNI
jgi:hypothetical protein